MSNPGSETNYVNDYATIPVPLDQRRSSFSLAMVLVGSIICLSSIYVGASFVGQLSLSEVVTACLVGNAVLSVLGGLLSYIGTKTGVGIAMLMRQSFGVLGNYIIAVLTAIVELGWFGYQCGFFGSTIHAMFPNAGFITEPVVAGIWGGLLMMTTAFIGYKGLELLSNIASPLILLTCVVACGLAATRVGGMEQFNQITLAHTGSMSTAVGIVSVIGAYAMGAVLQPDLTRYGKKCSDSVIGAVFGFIIANSFVIIAGFFICTVADTSDVAVALLNILSSWSLLLLILAQWTTNDNNLYYSSLAAVVAVPKWKKKYVVITFGIIATVAGALGIVNYFTTWLSILGTAIPPVAGILIVDYFCVKHQSYRFGAGVKHRFCSIPALVSWAIGCLVGYTVTWGIAAINSMVVTAIIYIALFMLFKNDTNRLYFGGEYVENARGELEKL